MALPPPTTPCVLSELCTGHQCPRSPPCCPAPCCRSSWVPAVGPHHFRQYTWLWTPLPLASALRPNPSPLLQGWRERPQNNSETFKDMLVLHWYTLLQAASGQGQLGANHHSDLLIQLGACLLPAVVHVILFQWICAWVPTIVTITPIP